MRAERSFPHLLSVKGETFHTRGHGNDVGGAAFLPHQCLLAEVVTLLQHAYLLLLALACWGLAYVAAE